MQSDIERLKQENSALRKEIELLKGAMAAQDEREQRAGESCGVSWIIHGCDWPEEVAEVVIDLRQHNERAIAELERMRGALNTCDIHAAVEGARYRTACALCFTDALQRAERCEAEGGDHGARTD